MPIFDSVYLPEGKNGWHPCKHNGYRLIHDATWVDGRLYEWLDKYGNREVARMKKDAMDHFYTSTKIIKEGDVVAFRDVVA